MVRWSADDIIYEDEQILVCRKHSGMAVQSARVGQMDLESELRNYRNGNYIGIVQRLDQPVEGVLVFGKTPQATAWLNKQHQNGMMKKEYLAVFTGTPVKEKQGIWEDYLIKDGKTNTSRVTDKKDKKKKKAVLSYSCRTELWTGEMTEDWQRSGWEPAGIIRFVCRWRIMGCRCGQTKNIRKKKRCWKQNRERPLVCVPGAWNLHIQRPGKK